MLALLINWFRVHIQSGEWEYLNEGNQHVVLKYIGNDYKYIEKVMRIKKDGGKKISGLDYKLNHEFQKELKRMNDKYIIGNNIQIG